MTLSNGEIKQLTQFKKDVGATEISPDNKLIAFTYRPGINIARLWIMNRDGSDLKKFTDGNNSQGASFSPDGKWIAFTAYADMANENLNSCEIYIMRVDGTDRRRLTENNHCDYQPRWGK